MNRRNGHDADADKVILAARAEAAIWITRLHGPLRRPQLEADFRRWLAERPENALEFEGVSEVWDLLGGTARAEIGHGATHDNPLSPLTRRSRRTVAWALAACLALALGGPLLMRLRTDTVSYHTAVGEQRTVRLEDGSRLTLNADAQITTDFTAGLRAVRLDRGEVFFEVAKDANRPFVVSAGERSVTALGTVFLVRRDPDQLAVTLIEGKVAVATADPPTASASAMPPAILHPGERMTLTDSTSPHIDHPLLDVVTAWRRGEVVLADTPLANAVAEMNRYDKTRIVLDSPRVAALPVSGLYHTGDNADFAASVARMYGLQRYENDGRIHLK